MQHKPQASTAREDPPGVPRTEDWTTLMPSLNPISTVTVATSRPQGWVEFDITYAVKQWQAGKPNYGLLLWATNKDTPGRGVRFASKAAPDPETHAFVHVLCGYEAPSPRNLAVQPQGERVQ